MATTFLRRPAVRPAALVLLAVGSYGTSFLRERYLYQRALGSRGLDLAVICIGIAFTLGNLIGALLAFSWTAGRVMPRAAKGAALGGVALLVLLAPVLGLVPLTAALVACMALFELGRVKAAHQGRQHRALLGALTAVVPTLGFWMTFGTGSTSRVLGGYLSGYLWQTAVAWHAGRRARPTLAAQRRSLGWLALYIVALQGQALIDRLLLLTAGHGWAASATLGYNSVDAATLVVAGPLAAEAMAGRLPKEVGRRNVGLLCLAGLGFVTVTPFFFSFAFRGGAVQGEAYRNLVIFAMIYGVALPASVVWLFRSRALQASPTAWRPVSVRASGVVALHLAVSVPLVLVHRPLLVPLGWVASTVWAAFSISRARCSGPLGPLAYKKDDEPNCDSQTPSMATLKAAVGDRWQRSETAATPALPSQRDKSESADSTSRR